MKKDARPTWIPFVSAIAIPALLLVLALVVARTYMPEQSGPDEKLLTTVHGQIYLSVKVEDSAGNPVADREVEFRHTSDGSTLEHLTRPTDSAGFVTVTLVKDGDVEVSVNGIEEPQKLLSIGESSRDSYELLFVQK